MEITVNDRVVDTPLVVMEFPAHRSDASLRSVTMTIVFVHRRGGQREFDDLLCGDHRPASSRVFSTFTRGTGPTGSRG